MPRTTGVWVLPKPRAEPPNNVENDIDKSEENVSRYETVKQKYYLSGREGTRKPRSRFRSQRSARRKRKLVAMDRTLIRLETKPFSKRRQDVQASASGCRILG